MIRLLTAILTMLILVSVSGQNLLNRETLKGRLPKGIEMSLSKDGPSFRVTGGGRMIRYRIALPEKAKVLFLSMMARTRDCVRGDEGWKNARLDLMFIDRNGKRVGPWLKTFAFTGTHDWTFCERDFEIPSGAAFIDVIPANYGKSGTIELKQIRLIPDSAGNIGDLPSPDGSPDEVLFSLKDAERTVTPMREKVTLNGLWRFFPVFRETDASSVPAPGSGWGYFKVPASFPELTQRAMGPGANNNIVYLPGKIRRMAQKEKIREAWYRRTVAVPASWNGRRIRLLIDMLQSVGTIFVDGKKAGTLAFPGGALDLTGRLIPGKTHELAVFVSAKPTALSTFMGETRMYQSLRDLDNRGLCGDVELESIPVKHSISDVLVIPSVEKKTITFDTGFLKLPEGSYRLKALVSDNSGEKKTFLSKPFSGSRQRVSFSSAWSNPKLWDIDTPQNLYTLRLELLSADGTLLDAFYPEEFGFREFRIRGRHFYLNGRKIHLRAAAVSNTRFSAKATDEMLAHMIQVYKKFHINFLLEAIYDFAPGTCCYNAAYWRATSKAGILTSMSMPHVKNFNFDLKNPVNAAEYRRIAEHQIRRYQNIPGIILFATSHNAMGYADQQNPDRIGSSSSGKTGLTPFSRNRRNQALLAEDILKQIDPSRGVYHHSGGNLGEIFTINCYLNWSPIQERSDWLEKWEKQGDLPLFFVEYGPPHIASYTSERGPQFLWAGNYRELHCLWFNEFNAAYLGEEAYRSGQAKEKYYRFEEKMSKGNRKNRPMQVHIVASFPDVDRVRSQFLARNLLDFRARGLSGIILWDFEKLFAKQGQSKPATLNPDRFRNLKRSAIVNDIVCIKDGGFTCDWFWPNDPYSPYRLLEMGRTVMAAWRPLTARIAGKVGDFTEQSHSFRPGERVRKSLQILNDTRHPQTVRCVWQIPGVTEKHSRSISVEPGERADLPIEFDLPRTLSGEQKILAEFHYPDGTSEQDSFVFTVLPEKRIHLSSTVGVMDPEGSARTLLKRLGVSARTVEKESDLAGVDLLILGRNALASLPFSLEKALADGLKMLVLEQSSETLNRIGFRTNEIGLRRVFPVSGFSGGVLRDWRGSSTLLPQYMPPQKLPTYPMTEWAGFMNRRIWRAGNRGTVASVLPEKPSIGNFLPLYQGGFDLQYAPLMEFREKKAVILFCQLDLSGRTEVEGEADDLLASLLERLENSAPRPARKVWYTGTDELRNSLASLRIPAEKLEKETLSSGDLLVIGPKGEIPEDLNERIREGLHVMTLGLSGSEGTKAAPGISLKNGVYFSDFCRLDSPEFAGLSNADLHFRWAQRFDAFPADSRGGRTLEGRTIGKGKLVMMQVPPWTIDEKEYALRSSRRRADFAMNRLLMNLGAESESGLLRMFRPESGNFRLTLSENWIGKEDPEKSGRRKQYYAPAFSPKGWRSIRVPGSFESQFKALEKYDGWFWYRLRFQVPAALTEQETILALGAVDDESWIWINGKLLGEVTRKTNPKNYWSVPRTYVLAPQTLRKGENTLCVLCNDIGMEGGILGNPVLRPASPFTLYTDEPIANDDPYRYFHW